MSDKPHYTTQQMIDALMEARGMVTVAASVVGCHPLTVRAYMRRYPTVAQALLDAREAMTDVAEMALYDAIVARESWAVTLYLKTIGKSRGYVERQEVTGKDGDSLFHLSPDEINRELTTLIDGAGARAVSAPAHRPSLPVGDPRATGTTSAGG